MKKIKYLLFLFFIFSFANVKALTLDQTGYEAYGIQRAYVICDYAFDLSSYTPTLKDFLLAAQSCPTDRISIYEIKISTNLKGETVRSYQELLSGSKVASFPAVNIRHFYTGAIGTSNKRTIDVSENDVIHYLDTISLSQSAYEALNIKRAYVVGSYIFDLSKHNPNLQDLMLASQYSPDGTAQILEIKISTNLSGEVVRSYQDLITGNKLNNFNNFDARFVMGSSINPNDHNLETRKDLITGESINNGTSESQTVTPEPTPVDPTDPRNKAINYNTSCMGYLTIPGTNGVVENRCIRWKDKSKNAKAETNNVSTGIYTLPVSNYPNVKNGNLVLAAHSGTASISYFKTLYLLKIGDIAKVKFNGNTYTYVIKNIYLVPKTGVVKITRNSSKTTLTLITCTKNDEAHQTVYILELRDIDGKEYS